MSPGPRASRRGVLLGGLGGAGALALTACGAHPVRAGTPGPPAIVPAADPVETADLGAALERLAATAYTLLAARIALGVAGPAPAAVTALLPEVRAAHTSAAAAWDALREPTTPAPTVRSTGALLGPVTGAGTVAGGLRALATVERTVAATYLQRCGLPAVGDTPDATSAGAATPSPAATVGGGSADARLLAIRLAATTAQHAAVLAALLGVPPAPDAFLSSDGALGTGVLTH